VGADFGFCGQSYAAPDIYQDRQVCINFYPEVSQSINSKGEQQGGTSGSKGAVIALLGCPGLLSITTLLANAEVRGCWVLPGNTQALFVAQNKCYVMTVTVPATQTSLPQFSVVQVGTLLTNNGQVCIRDNGAGGYAVIVDGPYLYYYRIAGAGTVTFTGGVTNTSTTMSVAAPLPAALIIAPSVTLTDSSGFILAGTTITNINYNTPSLTLSAAATGTNAVDTITLNIAQFGQITDPGFLGANKIAFIRGFLIFNKPNSQTFFISQNYGLNFNPLDFELNDGSSDNLVTLIENKNELWLIAERTTQPWYDSGGTFPFAPIDGAALQVGCSAMNTIARMDNDLIWLGFSERGQNVIVKTSGYQIENISTRAIEHAISQYPLVSDAFAYTYQEDGHGFYVITFPTADVTWVYDGSTKMWHERLSFDSVGGIYHRHRSNCYVNFANVRMVGDYQNGKVYVMSRNYYTDDGQPLIARRVTPYVWDGGARERIAHNFLQIEFSPGVGLASGASQDVDPYIMVSWIDENGQSNQHLVPIGKIGQARNRAIKRRLGLARARAYDVSISAAVNRDIVGATLDAS
jgi:hypothetical protein